ETLLVPGDRVEQLRHSRAGRVLVTAVGDRLPGGLEDLGRAVGVGEALAEVDRVVLESQGGHLGEDRRAEGCEGRVSEWAGHPQRVCRARLGTGCPRGGRRKTGRLMCVGSRSLIRLCATTRPSSPRGPTGPRGRPTPPCRTPARPVGCSGGSCATRA